ncbi:FecR family protein [Wenyingzhuangia sp. IMCC45574]
MNKKQARELYKKYLNNECTKQEKELLEQFLDSFQDKELILKDLNYDTEIKERLWSKIVSDTLNIKKETKNPIYKYLKYAAVIAITISATTFWITDTKDETLEIADASIILKTADNKEIVLDNSSQRDVYNGETKVAQQKGDIISFETKAPIQELVYNELKIPNGKNLQLKLSDGTLVHLNAGTSIKFPVNFINGKNREVYLDGEAYFEVTKDAKHPFIVTTEKMGVKVLGTHFNVNTYDQKKVHTVLAEGSVAVYDQKNKEDLQTQTIIVPGQRAILCNNQITVKKANVKRELKWREGHLFFNNDNFINIIKKIERKYNVTIVNNYTELNDHHYKGTFKDETILDLMNTFKESAGFSYAIKNNQIIINQPKH